jgi:hypothetical protein
MKRIYKENGRDLLLCSVPENILMKNLTEKDGAVIIDTKTWSYIQKLQNTSE